MADAPRNKRRRTDTEGETEPEPIPTPLTRSTEYWFEDGNIILQVESTQFRLFKGVLSKHSSVFRDMFTMPLPADEPTIEGCPIVVLSGDTVQDWTLSLSVLFPELYSAENPDFELLAAMLRLSKKYDCALFREDCVRRLKQELPTTLEEYDGVSLKWTFITLKSEGYRLFLPLISLARETGLPSLLPLLYCSAVVHKGLYMTEILDLENVSLSTIDRLACLRGHSKLLELQRTTTLAWLDLQGAAPHIPSALCTRRVDCCNAVKQIFHDIFYPHPPEITVLDEWHENWDDVMCLYCENRAKRVFEAGRKTCWEQLPAIFGLPSWEELKSLDFE
ncbi:hypothetical protein C8R46DRAFT_333753 [Mycena filopes]|nr:hypothetical protein C8R46DRAFT_333753 [Mycena filopes]